MVKPVYYTQLASNQPTSNISYSPITSYSLITSILQLVKEKMNEKASVEESKHGNFPFESCILSDVRILRQVQITNLVSFIKEGEVCC